MVDQLRSIALTLFPCRAVPRKRWADGLPERRQPFRASCGDPRISKRGRGNFPLDARGRCARSMKSSSYRYQAFDSPSMRTPPSCPCGGRGRSGCYQRGSRARASPCEDLELDDCLVRRAVQFRCLQQPGVVGLTFTAHEGVDEPSRWRRSLGRMLQRNDDIKALPWTEQRLASLQPLCGIQEGAVPDAECALGLLCSEGYMPSGEQTAYITCQEGSLIVNHA